MYSETCEDGTPLGPAICVPTWQVSPHARRPVLEVYSTSHLNWYIKSVFKLMCLFDADITNLNKLNKLLNAHLSMSINKLSNEILILDIYDFPHRNLSVTSLHGKPLSSTFMTSTLCFNVKVFFWMPFFLQNGSDRSKILNESWKRLTNSAINIVCLWTLSSAEKQSSCIASRLASTIHAEPHSEFCVRSIKSALGE